MLAKIVFFVGFVIGVACGISCPDADDPTTQSICLYADYGTSLIVWKKLVEQECDVSDVQEYWLSLFHCPNFAEVTCLDGFSRHTEADENNCTFAFCENGRYVSKNEVILKIHRQHVRAYKMIMDFYKNELGDCRPRICPNTTATTEFATTVIMTTHTEAMEHNGVRLIGGTSSYGRVELFHEGEWGTICDDSWDLKDAKVICRMLGFSDAISAIGTSRFGPGTEQIWLDNVDCSGEEDSISQCTIPSWGDHNCDHDEDASVVCDDGTATTPPYEPLGWSQSGNILYKCFLDRLDYYTANESCSKYGGRLAAKVLRDAVALNELSQKRCYFDEPWVGFDDIATGEWRWWDGGPMNNSTTKWREGKPSNYDEENCAFIKYPDNRTAVLTDTPCSDDQHYICEIEIDL